MDKPIHVSITVNLPDKEVKIETMTTINDLTRDIDAIVYDYPDASSMVIVLSGLGAKAQ